jgi:hypothetical protein
MGSRLQTFPFIQKHLTPGTTPQLQQPSAFPQATPQGQPQVPVSQAPQVPQLQFAPLEGLTVDTPQKERVEAYRALATQEGVDPNTVEAIAQIESTFNPKAEGPDTGQGRGTAKGEFQLLNRHALRAGVRPQDLFNPGINGPIAIKVIKENQEAFRPLAEKMAQSPEDVPDILAGLTIAAYHGGTMDDPNFKNVIPDFVAGKRSLGPKTESYVRKVAAARRQIMERRARIEKEQQAVKEGPPEALGLKEKIPGIIDPSLKRKDIREAFDLKKAQILATEEGKRIASLKEGQAIIDRMAQAGKPLSQMTPEELISIGGVDRSSDLLEVERQIEEAKRGPKMGAELRRRFSSAATATRHYRDILDDLKSGKSVTLATLKSRGMLKKLNNAAGLQVLLRSGATATDIERERIVELGPTITDELLGFLQEEGGKQLLINAIADLMAETEAIASGIGGEGQLESRIKRERDIFKKAGGVRGRRLRLEDYTEEELDVLPKEEVQRLMRQGL